MTERTGRARGPTYLDGEFDPGSDGLRGHRVFQRAGYHRQEGSRGLIDSLESLGECRAVRGAPSFYLRRWFI